MEVKQFGRSMIEMLGVLAIIGVLSIGGIVLYRRAVNNHQANTILDDANRLAFVLMESGRAFESYDNITGLEFTQTSPYFMNAFTEATSQQFAIMVTNVPKGVCEALLPKAAIEYKVRTLTANTIQDIAQVSPNSTLYTDSTDICNDINDAILYFGDVSKQCTDNVGKDCTSNADCCYGEFCWHPNEYPDDDEGCLPDLGKCKSIKSFDPETATMTDENTWTRSKGTMNWWSAQNWCGAQGLTQTSKAYIGCGSVSATQNCTSPMLSAIQNSPSEWSKKYHGAHWLDDYIVPDIENTCGSRVMGINDGWQYSVVRTMKLHAFCH